MAQDNRNMAQANKHIFTGKPIYGHAYLRLNQDYCEHAYYVLVKLVGSMPTY